jgi:two-component system, LuxR family, response regulator FixJ
MVDHFTVFVVDDDQMVRASLQWMLRQADLCVKSYSSGRLFLDAYCPSEMGCLVLDLRMPDMDGFALQKALCERKIRLPIIFVTGHGDVATCARAFREGAVDFLEKPVDDTILLDRIQGLVSRRAPCCTNGATTCFSDKVKLLTPTECEVLDVLILGKTIKEIALARRVAVQTVWRHQVNIFEKIGVESQIDLVRLVTLWQLRCDRQKVAGPAFAPENGEPFPVRKFD